MTSNVQMRELKGIMEVTTGGSIRAGRANGRGWNY